MHIYFKRNRGTLFLWLLFEFAFSLTMVYWSIFMKTLSDTAYGEAGLAGMKHLIFTGVSFLAIFFVVELLKDYFRSLFIRKCNLSLKHDLFQAIVSYDINCFNEGNSARFISALNNDVKIIEESYFTLIPEIISNVLLFLTALITIFFYSPYLAAIVLLCCAFQFVPPMLLGHLSAEVQEKYIHSLEEFNTKIKDVFSGFEVVKGFRAEAYVEKDFETISARVESDSHKMRIYRSISQAISYTFGYLSGVIQLALSVYLILIGNISMGVLLGAMQISNYVSNPAEQISEQIVDFKAVKPVIDRVLSIIEGHEKSYPNKESKEIPAHCAISVNDLNFSYEQGKPVLNHICCHFEFGKKYAIVGSSGSGKSTLLRLLMGYYDTYTGNIDFSGINIVEINKNALYKKAAMIHQKVFLFDDTLRNNITMYKTYPDNEILSAAQAAGLSGAMEKLGGLDGKIGEDGKNLSGGEQQRIAIARAFICGAEILLVDEATSSLDASNSKAIDDVLFGKKNLTLIAVTHKTAPENLEKYDEVLVLENGRLLETAPYDALSPQSKRILAV